MQKHLPKLLESPPAPEPVILACKKARSTSAPGVFCDPREIYETAAAETKLDCTHELLEERAKLGHLPSLEQLAHNYYQQGDIGRFLLYLRHRITLAAPGDKRTETLKTGFFNLGNTSPLKMTRLEMECGMPESNFTKWFYWYQCMFVDMRHRPGLKRVAIQKPKYFLNWMRRSCDELPDLARVNPHEGVVTAATRQKGFDFCSSHPIAVQNLTQAAIEMRSQGHDVGDFLAQAAIYNVVAAGRDRFVRERVRNDEFRQEIIFLNECLQARTSDLKDMTSQSSILARLAPDLYRQDYPALTVLEPFLVATWRECLHTLLGGLSGSFSPPLVRLVLQYSTDFSTEHLNQVSAENMKRYPQTSGFFTRKLTDLEYLKQRMGDPSTSATLRLLPFFQENVGEQVQQKSASPAKATVTKP